MSDTKRQSTAVDADIPPDRPARQALAERAEKLVAERGLRPPLPLEEIVALAEGLVDDPAYARYATVVLSNAIWADTVAAVPFERRLLLLPQCLRSRVVCPAAMDDYGLDCTRCGLCDIAMLLDEADRLGYVTLVAEGATLVRSLVASGQIEAVLGVGCLETLEEVFPHIQSGAVAGMAFPLIRSGCDQTAVDVDPLWKAIRARGESDLPALHLHTLRQEVAEWFTGPTLDAVWPSTDEPTVQLARAAVTGAGKRWRPTLLVAVARALGTSEEALPALAMAVECFHKASLVHDDIEDNDDARDGSPTLHAQTNVPIALNVGDWLIGQGYQLIADAPVDASAKAAMVQVAADGHRRLSVGQGRELMWAHEPGTLSTDEASEIAALKTSPAFEVALQLGALAAGRADLADALAGFSRAVGIAYQIRDDLRDADAGDTEAGRLSIVTAARAGDDPAAIIEALLTQQRTDARTAIETIKSPALRIVLHRVVGQLFDDLPSLNCLCP